MGELGAKVQAFWKGFEAGDMEAIVATAIAPDCEFTMPGAPPLRGADAVRGMFEAWRAAFPDMRHETVHAIESGDTYAAETRFSAPHRGPLRGVAGEIPATGRAVRWQSADVIRFREGKIASWHVYHDPHALLSQLGVG